eukprot:CAMPEP_0181393268 /NCGR_PEP_ID=MMETSP1106-20121128/27079_1 /TAXON_ID=81844 /ORGANISM="Mantoniella antarctica, Strain SL-175" /LENGTH=85 /DNA_ID=CAMNT_0023514537 /DNA_START=194 /DNA_END=449 /DNA_ORIENTATION=-
MARWKSVGGRRHDVCRDLGSGQASVALKHNSSASHAMRHVSPLLLPFASRAARDAMDDSATLPQQLPPATLSKAAAQTPLCTRPI